MSLLVILAQAIGKDPNLSNEGITFSFIKGSKFSKMNNNVISGKENECIIYSLANAFICHSCTSNMKKNTHLGFYINCRLYMCYIISFIQSEKLLATHTPKSLNNKPLINKSSK